MIWVYPPPTHPRRQRLWQVIHWRRHRRFQATLRDIAETEMRRAADEIYASSPLWDYLNREAE